MGIEHVSLLGVTWNFIFYSRFKNHKFYVCIRDKRVIKIDWNPWYAIFSTACSIVYKYCTRPIRRHLYSGILQDSLDRKYVYRTELNLPCLSCMDLDIGQNWTYPTSPVWICNLYKEQNWTDPVFPA